MAASKDYSTWSSMLPAGMGLDTVYVYIAALVLLIGTFVVGKSLVEPNATKVKIKELMQRRAELKGEYVSSKRKKGERKTAAQENVEMMKKIVQKFNLLEERQREEVTKLLISSGYRSKNAPIKFAFAQGISGFGFLFASLIFVKIDTTDIISTLMHVTIPFIAFVAGMKLPKILVINARNKRWGAIQKGLPDALDLMMICTEAGLTLTAALDRVNKEIGMAYPELAEEIAITSIEIGFLPERRKALENLAERVGLQEVRALVSILLQTEKYGTPISQALRVLAKEFRTQRMLRAEEKAARLPPMMTVPMIIFILPTLFIIVISPAVISMFAHTS